MNKSLEYFWIDEGRLLALEELFRINKSYPSVVIVDGEMKSWGRILGNFDAKSLIEFWEGVLSRRWGMARLDLEDTSVPAVQRIELPAFSFGKACNIMAVVFGICVLVVVVSERVLQAPLFSNIIP